MLANAEKTCNDLFHLDRMTAAGGTAKQIQQPYTVTNNSNEMKLVFTGKHQNTEVCIVGL